MAEWQHFSFDKIDSTNSEARRFAAANPDAPATFLAKRQTAGKGSRGRSFSSPDGGMYFSVLLPARVLADTDATALTAYTAVCALRAIENLTRVRPKVKWVNDLYLGGKKIAGILAEGEFDTGGTLRYTVIGIGVNLTRGILPPELAGIATTLEDETGVRLSPEELAKEFFRLFAEGLDRPTDECFYRLYRGASFLIGRDVTVCGRGEPYAVRVLDVGRDYSLRVRRADGIEESLRSGEVTIRPLQNAR